MNSQLPLNKYVDNVMISIMEAQIFSSLIIIDEQSRLGPKHLILKAKHPHKAQAVAQAAEGEGKWLRARLSQPGQIAHQVIQLDQ